MPLRWLGVHKNNPALLKEALAIDSTDIISRTQLVKFHLNQVDYATHHLVENLFIGSELESLEDLAEAKKLIADIQHEASHQHYTEWHLELSSLVNDWLEYNQKPEGTFPEWCKKNNKSYEWSTIVYYNE